jgi:NAD(P)H-hydrate epimerase
MALGPGLGQSEELSRLVAKLVTTLDKPLVIDADGLNLLSSQMGLLKERPRSTILTPHPGEFARLQGASAPSEGRAREEAAVQFARRHNVILILKGHGTVISDGDRLSVNPTGNPGMATGGTGDVLTGLIAALWGQGMSDFDAAQLAVYLHGRAGDIVAEEKGEISLIARDLVEALPSAFLTHRTGRG